MLKECLLGAAVIAALLGPPAGAAVAGELATAVVQSPGTGESASFDGVVDFEAATRDPNNPKRFKPEFDPGDHLHPNDAGYKAMANAIDLGIFKKK